MTDAKAYQATPHGTLLEQIMDSRVPKTEREHAAAREIERLRAALEKIADWNSNWGPFPENNEDWRAMAVVTAREAVPNELRAALAAQPATAAVPLTDEQIDKILDRERMRWVTSPPTYEFAHAFARAVERAHGIAAAGNTP